MSHWKGYSDMSLKRLQWWVTGHWKGYLWCVTKNATVMSDRSLKRLLWWVIGQWKGSNDIVDYVLTELQMKFLPGTYDYKSRSWGRKLRGIQSPKPHTMGCKEPKPWSPRWVRERHREKNNGIPPNDPNHDEKPPADAERPLCKCDLDYQSHMSLEHDTYGRRYWSCPLPLVHSIGVGTRRNRGK
jgi:hypothetical protein